MARKALLYVAGLTGLYLAVVYSTGFGADVKAAANGATTFEKTLQGR